MEHHHFGENPHNQGVQAQTYYSDKSKSQKFGHTAAPGVGIRAKHPDYTKKIIYYESADKTNAGRQLVGHSAKLRQSGEQSEINNKGSAPNKKITEKLNQNIIRRRI